MKPLVISERALSILGALDLQLDSLLAEDSPNSAPSNVSIGTHGVYIFTSGCTADSRLLVIRRWADGLFSAVPISERQSVFDRCIRIALRSFDKSVALNPKWMPYHQDNRVSIFAYGPGSYDRIVAEVNFLQQGDTYIYEMGTGSAFQNLTSLEPHHGTYKNAKAEYISIAETNPATGDNSDGNIDLDLLNPDSIVKGFGYEDWLLHLSPRQRQFVDHGLTGPLRLRGAAGTGKTLAMVMKAIRLKKAAKPGERKKILFLTHSWAMAEQIDGLIRQLDHDTEGASTIEVYPLLEVARQRDYAEIGRQPLGVDSEEGKRRALLEICGVISDFRSGDWLTFKGGCTESFVRALESDPTSRNHQYFAWDLLIEFGCVLAAQGILGRASDLEKYAKIRRMGYMMPLANQEEREVVFELWSLFLQRLRDHGMISSDQIVSDILTDLQTFYWEAARVEKGYDVIFVDETHLFNAQERLTFHHLLVDGDSPPLVVMALDPKQSPREVFTALETEGGDATDKSVYDRARLPNTELIDFVDVYRYTPEIDRLIKVVLNSVPGLDLDSDWNVPAGVSGLKSGPIPSFKVVKDKLTTYKDAISLAKQTTSGARQRGGRVAILSMDHDRFSEYARAARGQEAKDVFVIASRDDTAKLPYMAKKIVFSTPEYVAGLQFDTVILLDVNRNGVPEGGYTGHQQRRFLSELYLGMSRAEHQLFLFASKDGDGLTPFLDNAVRDKIMIELK